MTYAVLRRHLSRVWQDAKARAVCIWPGEVQQVQLGKAELTGTDLRTVGLVQSIYDRYTKIPLTRIKGTACSHPIAAEATKLKSDYPMLYRHDRFKYDLINLDVISNVITEWQYKYL